MDVVTKDGGKISLKKTGTKEGSEDKWEVVASSVKIDKLDNAVPSGIVTALSSWKTNDFADGTTLAAAGLDAPALTVTVGLKGGKAVVALVGGKKGDDFYVKKADAPQVFVVKKFGVEKVNKRPIDFRDKTLCDSAAADLTEVAVTSGDKSYTLVKSGATRGGRRPSRPSWSSIRRRRADRRRLQGLEGDRLRRRQSLKGNGLAKPKASSPPRPANGRLPGARRRRDQGQGQLLRRPAKSTDVYLAPKWSMDRILVKPDDLKKTAGAATAPAPTKPGKPAGKPTAAAKK